MLSWDQLYRVWRTKLGYKQAAIATKHGIKNTEHINTRGVIIPQWIAHNSI